MGAAELDGALYGAVAGGESCCWIENGLGVAVAISVLKNLELRELNHAGRTETASGWFGPPWLL